MEVDFSSIYGFENVRIDLAKNLSPHLQLPFVMVGRLANHLYFTTSIFAIY